MQPLFKLRNSKWCSICSLTIIEYSRDKQRLWSDCAYAQADLSLCWSHIPHCWKSHVAAHINKLSFRQKQLSVTLKSQATSSYSTALGGRDTKHLQGAQWKSAWLETEGPRVRASPASLSCGPWARHIYPSLVLVQPRKTCPCLTERLVTGHKESNQTNKHSIGRKRHRTSTATQQQNI